MRFKRKVTIMATKATNILRYIFLIFLYQFYYSHTIGGSLVSGTHAFLNTFFLSTNMYNREVTINSQAAANRDEKILTNILFPRLFWNR